MPIYEFYCRSCHTLFNFFSKTVNTDKRPRCPQCKTEELSRQMSPFAVTGRASESDDMDALPFDESKMEQAMQLLAGEAGKIDEEDPRQTAGLMRKLTRMTGMELGSGMEEALSRMENGEDPEAVEAEMGDLLEREDPFLLPGKRPKGGLRPSTAPRRDDTLYDL